MRAMSNSSLRRSVISLSGYKYVELSQCPRWRSFKFSLDFCDGTWGFLICLFWLASRQPVKKQLCNWLTLTVDDEIWGLLGCGVLILKKSRDCWRSLYHVQTRPLQPGGTRESLWVYAMISQYYSSLWFKNEEKLSDATERERELLIDEWFRKLDEFG